MTYQSIARQYLANDLKPIPARGKAPIPSGATGRGGTVTVDKVEAWIADEAWRDENVALRAEGYAVIDVDHYGDKHGADQLAALEVTLGKLPATITNSSRGEGSPSHQKFFNIPAGIELAGKADVDIDVLQAHHRYAICYPSVHPVTGSQYQWFGYDGKPLGGIPHRLDFEDLPQPWVEYLVAKLGRTAQPHAGGTNAPQIAHSGFDGGVEEWVDTTEDGPASPRVLEFLKTIPAGDFGHDEMIQLSFNLVRLGAEGQPGIREALTALYAAWMRPPYDTPDNRIGIDTAVGGAITKAGAREYLPELSDLFDLAQLPTFPKVTSDGQSFLDLLTKLPEVQSDGGLWQARQTIMVEALRAGMAPDEAVSAAWAASVGAQLRGADNGQKILWTEFSEAKVAHESSLAAPAEGQTDQAPATGRSGKTSFVSETERARVASYRWFGTDYLDWARSRVAIFNGPYHRLNRWMILSVMFSDCGVVPVPGPRPLGTNLYMLNLGDTTTGKTEAQDMALSVVKAASPFDDRPDLGGDFSNESLIGILTKRDGKTSLFNRDEADGFFEKAASGGYTAGIIPTVTALHSGDVPTIYRQGDKESSGQHATTQFCMYLMGTITKLSGALDKSLWESGFLARYIWTMGEPATITDDMYRVKILRGEQAREYNSMPRQWASEFAVAKRRLALVDSLPLALDMTDEAIDRLSEFNILTSKIPNGHRHADVLVASVSRFRTNVLKCAMLVAMSEGAHVATLDHVLIAIEQAEEWLDAMLVMIEQTTASGFAREVDALESFLLSRPGRSARIAEIHKWSPKTKFETERWIEQLLVEERALPGQDLDLTPTVIARVRSAA